jgi:hypothetical protein
MNRLIFVNHITPRMIDRNGTLRVYEADYIQVAEMMRVNQSWNYLNMEEEEAVNLDLEKFHKKLPRGRPHHYLSETILDYGDKIILVDHLKNERLKYRVIRWV